jgi:hypothetical protein
LKKSLIFFSIFVGLQSAMAMAKIEINADGAVISNEHYRYVFETKDGLKLVELNNTFTADNNLKDTAPQKLGLIDIGSEHYALNEMQVQEVRQSDGNTIQFLLTNPSLECTMSVRQDASPETEWVLNVKNVSGVDESVKVTFPLLTGIVAGSSIDNMSYYHGLNGFIYGKSPAHVCGADGYSFPVMDVFNKKLGGVYCIVKDTKQEMKSYEVIKKVSGSEAPVYSESWWSDARADNVFETNEGCGMAVTHAFTNIANGESYQTPLAALGVHPGRWEKAWESYRQWLLSVTKRRAPVQWFRECFFSKAIHEQHFWKEGHFDWSDTIQSFDQYTYFDINHWMDTRGDYNVRPEMGGPEALKAELAKLRQKDIRSALYMEACCLNPASRIGMEHGEEWAVLKNGKRVKSEGDTEYNMCPGSDWAEYLAATTSRVARQTNTDAIYMDSLGLRFHQCEDPAHNHPFKRGWRRNVGEAFKRVAEEIDKAKKNTVIYTEYYSSDINSQHLNGSYNPGVGSSQGITQKGFDFCRTGTNLFRFYFPDFKLIEIMNQDEPSIGLALFNGNGIHEFFTDKAIWPFLEECGRIWSQNVDAFTSDYPEPLLETGNDDIYMNKFPTDKKTVYTIWNASDNAIEAGAIDFNLPEGLRCVDLLRHQEVPFDAGKIKVDLPSKRVALVATLPHVLNCHQADPNSIELSYGEALHRPSIVVYYKTADRWENKQFEFEESPPPVNDNSIYNPDNAGKIRASKKMSLKLNEVFEGTIPANISIALLSGGKLIDEVVLSAAK